MSRNIEQDRKWLDVLPDPSRLNGYGPHTSNALVEVLRYYMAEVERLRAEVEGLKREAAEREQERADIRRWQGE